MAAGDASGGSGVRMALGIVLVWFGGAALFVAFMSGKTPSLAVGRDASGKLVGPRTGPELLGRVARNIQAAGGGVGGAAAGPGLTSKGTEA